MSAVFSANPFDALGNDTEPNVDEVQVAKEKKFPSTKATTSSNKKDTRDVQQEKPRSGANRRTEKTGNERAFANNETGREYNRTRPTDEQEDGRRGGARRGGRGGRPPRDDRQTKGLGRESSDKQTAQSWGAVEGKAELKDEEAGEQIAQEEKKEDVSGEGEAAADAEPAEPEAKQLTLAEYQEKMSEVTASLNAGLSIRAANEGSTSQKWAQTELKKEEEDYLAGSTRAHRERSKKNSAAQVTLDHSFQEVSRPARGGRAEGGRFEGRGENRENRENRGPRGPRGGDRAPRGERGGRGSGPRPRRGDAGAAASAAINTQDESAFPSLGA